MLCSNSDMSKMFHNLVGATKEAKTQKMMRKHKLRLQGDRIMIMDTSTMTSEQQ